MTESILNLDEKKILGYFEGCRCTFRFKLILLFQLLDENGSFQHERISPQAIDTIEQQFPDDLFFRALKQGNSEIIEYFKEDIIRGAIVDIWSVFELITKSLLGGNYSLQEGDVTMSYEASKFGFSKREKKDLELLYYFRNSLVHHNGAYFKSKAVSHKYSDTKFDSEGNEGEIIEMSLMIVSNFIRDVESLSLKAWSNSKKIAGKQAEPE